MSKEGLTGKCGCGAVTYRLGARPMFVHCCHCRDCQRQTGSAYVLNALIEIDHVDVVGQTRDEMLPTDSGRGQIITRCAACGVAICSRYMIREGRVAFVRVGTLDTPDRCPPDVQIFTRSKLPWVPLNPGIPSFETFYRFKYVWPEASFARLIALLPERRKGSD